MTTDVILNPLSKLELDSYIDTSNHAVGIVGQKGIGKYSVIMWMLSQYLPDLTVSIDNYPYLKVISDDKGSISIDGVRELNQFLKLKIPGNVGMHRFVVIDHADNLTLEAQNALLKTLEEPPADTLILLSINSEMNLLPTIKSRIQMIHIKRPARSDIVGFYSNHGHSPEDIDRAYLVSSGLMGIMNDFLNKTDSDILSVVEEAKQVLRSTAFDRLNLIDSLYKDKLHCQALVKMLIQIGQSGLESTADKQDTRAMLRWQKVLSAAERAEKSLLSNAQPKLVLTDLMLSL